MQSCSKTLTEPSSPAPTHHLPRDPSPGLAVALQAVCAPRDYAAPRPVQRWAPRWLKKWKYVGAPSPDSPAPIFGNPRPLPRVGWRAQYAQEEAAVRAELRRACPFSDPDATAFRLTMPPELELLAKHSAGAIDPLRLWTTFLCRSFLRGKHEHFLVVRRFLLLLAAAAVSYSSGCCAKHAKPLFRSRVSSSRLGKRTN